MNEVLINNKIYNYESLFTNKKIKDFNGKPFPQPKKHYDKWNNQDMFIKQLQYVQQNLKLHIDNVNVINSDKYCLLCEDTNKKNKGYYQFNNIRWMDGLYHYIVEHNYKPSDIFIDMIFKYSKTNQKSITRLSGTKFKKSNKKFIKIDKNQLKILDSLMYYGGKKIYNTGDNTFRYSEHAGLLDFNFNELQKVIVYGNTTRVNKNDDSIYLPGDMEDAPDYEYIFHTHPPTPTPGGRANIGILYEIPSMGDIFHYIDNHNNGYTQGSIIVAPEGLYIIRKLEHDFKKIKLDEDKLYNSYLDKMFKYQTEAIQLYGVKFTTNIFYSKIAQDKTVINKLNNLLKTFGLYIDYYPRIKNKKDDWILDTIYLPIIPIMDVE
jgi:hypothetical protein